MPMPMPGQGAPPPGGAAPPGMPPGAGGQPAPPVGTGGVTGPGPQAGSAAQGLSQLKLAAEMMTKALAAIPMGSPLHNDTMKAISLISKNLSSGADDQSGMMQQLSQLARQAQSDPQRQAMMRNFPPAPAASAAPPAQPAMAA